MGLKVLVISHNCFSTFQNMGKALRETFIDFDNIELCQLYLYPSHPNIDVCSSYFRITDKDALKSIFKRNRCGTLIDKSNIKVSNSLYQDNKDVKIYKKYRTKKDIMILGREIIWKLSNWKNKELFRWIEDENPNVIFFAAGDAWFSYDISLYISRKYNIPIIPYVCDDYYLLERKTSSIIYKIHKYYLKRKMKDTFITAKSIVTICDKLSNEYNKLFNVKTHTFMTSTSLKIDHEYKDISTITSNKSLKISYLGNVGLKRWESLVDIGKALKNISKKYGMNYYIDLYSMEIDENITRNFIGENGIKFHGGIDGDKVPLIMKESDILLHVESFDEYYIDRVKYSVSTKISDSLASGTCIFAYGPKNVASIEHLLVNDAACVATDYNILEKRLEEILLSEHLRKTYVEKAKNLAEDRHDAMKNSKNLKVVLESIL